MRAKKPTKTDVRIQELLSWIAHNEDLIERFKDGHDGSHDSLIAMTERDIAQWKEELDALGYKPGRTKTIGNPAIYSEVVL